MGGGLLQLVAYGAQDIYLTGSPQITFFKVVYRRHTNFSIESIQQTFNGNALPGNRVTCQISRNGDLVNKMYIVLKYTNNYSEMKHVGYKAIKKVEIEIGGQMIDRQYGEWMYIWNELSLPAGKKLGFNYMVNAHGRNGGTVYIPLEFWFCRNIGLALPLIALQYHEVKVNVEFNTNPSFTNAEFWVDYVYLDTDERRRFAQMSHEYLIDQVQYTGPEAFNQNSKVRLNFNHPTKEIIWVACADTDKFTYHKIGNGKLQLNGNDRFATRDNVYFTHVQPYSHHTNIPTGSVINVYSFGLKPEEHQPSGTLNFSRIDTAYLHVDKASGDTTTNTLMIFATNYNVLRILSGMGGLAYSN